MATAKTNSPYVHLELLSQTGETGKKGVGSKPFVLILTAAYESDGTAETIKRNLLHSAEVLNSGKPDTNPAAFPFIAYPADVPFGGVNRESSWVYLSPRNLLNQIEKIKTWMKKIGDELTATQGLKPEKMKVDTTQNTACLYKLAWNSGELVKNAQPNVPV